MTESNASAGSWNDIVITQFLNGDQRIAEMFDRGALLLLHTTGARSGQPRTSPLAYLTLDDEIILVASAGGSDANPAWYFNLLAHPDVTFERWQDDAIESVKATAVPVEPEERDRLWPRITALAPGFGEYQTQTSRVIPVIILRRA